MDLERFPSGKFATNQLVMACNALVYNILRFIGQLSLVTSKGIIRHPAKRRRIKTVIQELIYFSGRLISTGRRLKLRFSRHVHGHVEAFRHAFSDWPTYKAETAQIIGLTTQAGRVHGHP